MSVIKIEASIECEGCGKHFRVEIDTGMSIPLGWDIIDVARNAVAGGNVTEFEKRRDPGSSSVQGGKVLCPDCTQKADEAEEVEEECESER